MAAGAIAAVAAAQHRIIRAFRKAGATEASSARTLQELDLRDDRMFRAFVRDGAIVQTDRGHYLDVPRLEERQRGRQKTALILVGTVLLIVAIVALISRAM